MIEALPRRIHFVGIGGIGLSAIARVLAQRGHVLSGSDLAETDITRGLASLGVRIYHGHAAEQIGDAELVVISSAIPEHNVEVQAARAAGIPVVKRQDLLGKLMAGQRVVAISGTHGKTTTSAMIATILQQTDQDPSFIVGGILNDLGTNAQAGQGPCFVIEADEYDYMFLGLAPDIAIITHIELDHPDIYPDVDAMREAFEQFIARISPHGTLVACVDSSQVRRLLAEIERSDLNILLYGQAQSADYRIVPTTQPGAEGTAFQVWEGNRIWVRCALRIPGVHNALNGTAALLAATCCGVDPSAASAVLAEFHGVKRRFELKGTAWGVTVIDDYAHHPTEVRATLSAARSRYPNRRLAVVFQPHTYSRIQALLTEFSHCFELADEVVITDIFRARARERATISAERMVAAIHHPAVQHIGTADEIVAYLATTLRPNDVLLTLGAGDSYRIGERVLAMLREREVA